MEKIISVLLRFCSYCNDLGDRFSIGEGNKKISYDLNERTFPFTVNICCIGRFGKGKSTCVNCILGEKKARESKSGATSTRKLNFYQVSKYPIKIYDIPGFENEETVNNAIMKMDELNDEINELQDQLHVLIYIIKSDDERMFAEIEYGIFRKITEQKKSRILYVLTHSSLKTDKEELIDMINIGIKGLLEKHPKEKEINNEIFELMKANENNCILVNFHPKDNTPVFGIKELFTKISEFAKESDIYKKFNSRNETQEEFNERIREEAEIRKKRALKVLFWHTIGGGVIGLIPGVDILVQKLLIKRSAAKKIGQIFGVDINIVNNTTQLKNDNQNLANIEPEKAVEILPIKKNELDNKVLNKITIVEEDSTGMNKEKKNNKEKEEKLDEDNTTTSNDKKNYLELGGRGGSLATNSVVVGTGIASFVSAAAEEAGQIAAISGSLALRVVSISFLFVGAAIGVTVGSYFTYDHCNELINKLYQYFIENTRELSGSLDEAIKYLNNMPKEKH